MLVGAVRETGDLLTDDLQEAALCTLHVQEDFLLALGVFFVIFCTPETQK